MANYIIAIGQVLSTDATPTPNSRGLVTSGGSQLLAVDKFNGLWA
jgi:hypothetical protein